MKSTIDRLNTLIKAGKSYLDLATKDEMLMRKAPTKWSKKEILGHLIDSAVNNLQRFTEIQFEDKPYKIRKYNQAGLVEANGYHDMPQEDLTNLWTSLNYQIRRVIELQNEESLAFKIELSDGEIKDLRFLMTDYVDHMEHHIKQILGA